MAKSAVTEPSAHVAAGASVAVQVARRHTLPSSRSESAPPRADRSKWIPLGAGLLLALPILIGRYPPMTDLPHYEALVGLLRHHGDTRYFPSGLYTLNFGHPNQLFYLIAWPLSYVVPTDWACKIVVSLAVLGVAFGAGRLAAHLKASPWVALAVAPLALGWPFYWGLSTNILGLGVLLACLPTFDRLAEEPTVKRALYGCGGMVALYLAHEAMMIVGCVAVAVFALGHRIQVAKTALRLAPAAFATALFYAQLQYQKRTMSMLDLGVETTYHPILRKLKAMPGVLLGGHGDVPRYTYFALLVVAVAVFAAAAHKGRPKVTTRGVQELLRKYRFGLFAVGAFAAYLAMPFTVNGATMIYHRFLGPAYAVAAIALAGGGIASTPRIARILAAVLPIGWLFVIWPEFADSNRAYRELDQLLPMIEMNSAVAQLEIGTSTEGRVFSAASGGTRALPTRGGRMLYSFTDSAIAPVQINRAYRWEEPVARVIFDGFGFIPAHDFKRFRYAIVHNPGGEVADIAILAMAPEGHIIGQTGEWMLFESTLERVPLESPDVKRPRKVPTLGQRMQGVIDQSKGANKSPVTLPAPAPEGP